MDSTTWKVFIYKGFLPTLKIASLNSSHYNFNSYLHVTINIHFEDLF